MKGLTLLFLACLSCAACHVHPAPARPRLEESGSLYLYLEPFPLEAARLSFRITSIDAFSEDGHASGLELRLPKAEAWSSPSQRLLALGELPPGRYAGLWMRVEDASLRGEHGASALAAPAEPTVVTIPFTAVRRRAVVLRLRLDYRASVPSGYSLTPVFEVTIPGKIATGLVGLASSPAANVVTVFDKISGQVCAIVPTGSEPTGIALDQARQRAFVAASGDDAIEVLDLQEDAIVDTIALTGGDRPVELALTPDGRTLLAVDAGSNMVSYIDTQALYVTDRVAVGNGPRSILMDRPGRRAFVFNGASDSISVLDVPARTVIATIATDAGPLRGQFDRSGTRIYVVHASSPYLAVVDPVSLTVTRRMHIGAAATAFKVDPQTDRVYVGRASAGSIDVYDPLSFLPIDSIPAEGEVAFLAHDGEQKTLCVALAGPRSMLRFVRAVGWKTVAETELGEDPVWVALMGER